MIWNSFSTDVLGRSVSRSVGSVYTQQSTILKTGPLLTGFDFWFYNIHQSKYQANVHSPSLMSNSKTSHVGTKFILVFLWHFSLTNVFVCDTEGVMKWRIDPGSRVLVFPHHNYSYYVSRGRFFTSNCFLSHLQWVFHQTTTKEYITMTFSLSEVSEMFVSDTSAMFDSNSSTTSCDLIL